jgi:hypothetical protein
LNEAVAHLYSPVMDTARMLTGGPASARARSGDVTITAAAPSDSIQQSYSRRGSAMIREAWCSSTVISWRNRASGLLTALRRALIATSARWSAVVPYRLMCRRAFIA